MTSTRAQRNVTVTLHNVTVTSDNALPALREDRVLAGAQWLADLPSPPPNIIPELKQRFELSTVEAISAIRRAEEMRVCRRAFG